MVQYRRYVSTNPVFITIVTGSRNPWLVGDEGVGSYQKHFQRTLDHFGWRWIAWALLPDHLHWLIAPNRLDRLNDAYSDIVRGLKWSMSVELGKEIDGKPRWQRRFWEHTIKDDEDLQRHFDYIHFNPVKHGYADHPGKWPHSSFRHYVNEGWYSNDWADGSALAIPEMDQGYD